MNNGILVKVEEDVVGFQGNHIPHHLEGSGAVEVPGVISDDGPGNTSRNSPMFPSSIRLPIFISLPLFQGDIPGLLQNY